MRPVTLSTVAATPPNAGTTNGASPGSIPSASNRDSDSGPKKPAVAATNKNLNLRHQFDSDRYGELSGVGGNGCKPVCLVKL